MIGTHSRTPSISGTVLGDFRHTVFTIVNRSAVAQRADYSIYMHQLRLLCLTKSGASASALPQAGARTTSTPVIWIDRPVIRSTRGPHWGQHTDVHDFHPLHQTLTMGQYWSSYAGSSDIAAFADLGSDGEGKQYDYIICGGESIGRGGILGLTRTIGGTAGCVIASRVRMQSTRLTVSNIFSLRRTPTYRYLSSKRANRMPSNSLAVFRLGG